MSHVFRPHFRWWVAASRSEWPLWVLPTNGRHIPAVKGCRGECAKRDNVACHGCSRVTIAYSFSLAKKKNSHATRSNDPQKTVVVLYISRLFTAKRCGWLRHFAVVDSQFYVRPPLLPGRGPQKQVVLCFSTNISAPAIHATAFPSRPRDSFPIPAHKVGLALDFVVHYVQATTSTAHDKNDPIEEQNLCFKVATHFFESAFGRALLFAGDC
jgi:hypothetical protein